MPSVAILDVGSRFFYNGTTVGNVKMRGGGSMEEGFYRKFLKGSDASLYDAVVASLRRFETETAVPISLKSGMGHTVHDILSYLHYDHPEFCFCTNKYTVIESKSTMKVVIHFQYDERGCRELYRRVQNKVDEIVSGCRGYDVVAKERYLHDYLTKHVTYYKVNGDRSIFTAAGALLNGRAVCEGIAKAFQLLCDRCGIPCMYVFGEANNRKQGGIGAHAWNIVMLQGDYYHVDVTWDGGSVLGEPAGYAYFNLPDWDIAKSHRWNRSLTPACNSTEENYFIKEGLFFRTNQEIERFLRKGYESGKRKFYFKVGNVGSSSNDMQRLTEDIEGVVGNILKAAHPGKGYSYSIQFSINPDQQVVTMELEVEF